MENFTIFKVAYLLDNNVLSNEAKKLIKENVNPEMVDEDGLSAQYCMDAVENFFNDNITAFSEADIQFLYEAFTKDINYLEF
jgi:Na+-transporting NADH:ubiquinone oxidoreductase subunit NqrC